ncbi:MAG: M14 metallopeptidase family protein [Cyclobacteriaceae bacterium]
MRTVLFWIFLLPLALFAQNLEFDSLLFDNYEKIKEPSLDRLRIKHADLQPLIEKVAKTKGYTVTQVGESIEGRSISLISVGTGDIDVLLWSQMHGDEPTATMAIFDILNFLQDKKTLKKEKKELLTKVRLHFIPMLNPDGAEQFKRRNALDIDLNRDALRLQTPEARILKGVRDSLDADFGFNLHDQSTYYNAERTAKPATISYLAPAYNYEKSINEVRGNAMKIIVYMNDIIQRYAPGQVGRYNDDFEPRAFGDNIQKWGTSTILIESGGYPGDSEKQFIRKLNYLSILSSVFAIANDAYQQIDIKDYEKIPNNDRKLFDLKVEGMTYYLDGKPYILDLGIYTTPKDNSDHTDYHYLGSIGEVGDLSTYYGYKTVEAAGLTYAAGKVFVPETTVLDSLANLDFGSLLAEGYTDILLTSKPETAFSPLPLNLTLSEETKTQNVKLWTNATFLLMDGEEVRYAIVNGFLFDVSDRGSLKKMKNGVIR